MKDGGLLGTLVGKLEGDAVGCNSLREIIIMSCEHKQRYLKQRKHRTIFEGGVLGKLDVTFVGTFEGDEDGAWLGSVEGGDVGCDVGKVRKRMK